MDNAAGILARFPSGPSRVAGRLQERSIGLPDAGLGERTIESYTLMPISSELIPFCTKEINRVSCSAGDLVMW